MSFAPGKPYEGYLWGCAEKATPAYACSKAATAAKSMLKRSSLAGRWLDSPELRTHAEAEQENGSADGREPGRFAIKLKEPGSVAIGYAFLQTGAWGRFKIRQSARMSRTVSSKAGSRRFATAGQWSARISLKKMTECALPAAVQRHLVSRFVKRLGDRRLLELLRGGRVFSGSRFEREPDAAPYFGFHRVCQPPGEHRMGALLRPMGILRRTA